MEKTIKIKLLIGDEETTAVMKLAENMFDDLVTKAAQLKASPVLQQFAKDLLDLDQVSEQATEGIADFIKYNEISEKQLLDVSEQLRAQQSVLGMGTAEYKKHQMAIENVTNAYEKVKTSQINSAAATNHARAANGSMNSVISQTGFLLSDMDMFFVNWRMGLMSVSNNFSMVTNTIGYAINDAKMKGLSFAESLKQSLTGFNLFTLGLNAGFFVIQMLTRLISDNTKELEKNTEELEKNKKALAEKSRVALNATISDLETEYDLLKKKMQIEKEAFEHQKKLAEASASSGGIGKFSVSSQRSLGEFRFSQQDELTKAGQKLSQAQTQLAMLGEEQSIQNRINELIATRKTLQDGGHSTYRTYLNEEIEKLETQMSLMQGKENKEKTLAQIMKIRTDEEINKEIQKLELLMKQYGAMSDQLRIRAQIKKLEEEKLEPFKITKEDTLTRGLDLNNLPKFDMKLKESLTPMHWTELIGPMFAKRRAEYGLDEAQQKTDTLKTSFMQLGSVIGSAFARGLTHIKNFKDVLSEILGMIAEMVIRFALSKIPVIGPFLTGIPTGSRQSIPEATSIAALGPAQQSVVNINVQVSGQSLTRGRDIYTSYNNTSQLVAAFK